MRIAILHYSASPVIGGVEGVIQAHARMLAEAGIEVVVVAGEGDQKAMPPGVEFRRVEAMSSQNPQILQASSQLERGIIPDDFSRLSDELGTALTPILEKMDCTIIHNVFTKHFNLPLTDALYRLLDQGKLRGCIAWGHDFTWTSPHSSSKVRPGYPWDLLRTYRADVSNVVVSTARQKELAHLYGCSRERVQVIYNGVDPDGVLGYFSDSRELIERLNLGESDLILLMPVRITQAKNIEYAIKVVAALKSKGVDPRLVVTGPPDPHDEQNMAYYDSLKDLRKKLEVDKEVRFVYESGGNPNQANLVDMDVVGVIYRTADLMLMPSHREGFGMPVLEAGLAGLPVFSTEIPATMEIAHDEVQFIDADQPPESTALKILDWAEHNPVHRLKRRVRQSYTWGAICRQQILPLVTQVVKR